MTRRESSGPHGILLLDKPNGPTSHDLVARTRRALGTRKVGHAGTLDPMATGLLVLGVGDATRLLTYFVGADKEYLATVRLGVSTNTEDAEGEITARAEPGAIARLGTDEIDATIASLTGRIRQVPSAVSAIKVDGVRAYKRVRDGEQVELDAREVDITEFVRTGSPRRADGEESAVDVDVRVACSSGTYVRALARDLGDALGVGAHLVALRRTRVGAFRVDEASDVERTDLVDALLAPAAAALRRFERLDADERDAADLRNGRVIARGSTGSGDEPLRAAIDATGALIGIVGPRDGGWKSVMNLPTGGAS
ncbi:tRNA pseudouridine(55) synthase TruB [Pseudoclavibacter chungangensis]|uniref:tRNA pseudouridine synthase B n=1 Tax=Pseudoclavibacter chungangensis TaxID=587635 RepID=A0A7J5BSS1_9MICO|nr:tRNA pseudouridine(55) synthase TruB [Pseudoclavibacter chungangensis]KAB1657296.1 tRNA pseudouridine(55) synthase TruB [Pseudoclavibacter chungangensis]NYJ66256.1 tRNA pseudouridine55 synthase [Pseudoclavibacter chungangensis]